MWTCQCCHKVLPDSAFPWVVVDEEGEEVEVGSDCGKKTRAAGTDGYEHPKTGVLLFTKSAYNALNQNVGMVV